MSKEDLNNYDHLVKILMIGESGVGKTCLLHRYSKNVFPENHLPTIAIDFMVKMITVKNTKLKMQIWDTAGQERFRKLTTGFFKNADGAVVVYSVTDRASFERVQEWTHEVSTMVPEGVSMILVGNKSDLSEERKVSYEEGLLKRERVGTQTWNAVPGGVGKVGRECRNSVPKNSH